MPLGELLSLATALCWALTNLFFGEATRRVGAFTVNMMRLPVALAVLTVPVFLMSSPWTGAGQREVGLLAVSGLVGLLVGDIAWLAALPRLGARLTVLVLALAPVFASLAGLVILGEHLGPSAVVGIAVTLAGVALVVTERGSGPATAHLGPGLVLALVAASCQGIALVVAKLGMAEGISALSATWVRLVAATAGLLVLAAARGRLRPRALVRAAHPAAWAIAGGILLGPLVGVWLSLVAVRLTDVGVAATLMATSPVLIIPVAMITERYRPTLRATLGTLVAVAGVALLMLR